MENKQMKIEEWEYFGGDNEQFAPLAGLEEIKKIENLIRNY